MKALRFWSIQVVLFGLLLSIQQCSAQSEFKVVGYLPAYRFALHDKIEWEKLTHVCLGFAHPDDKGYVLMDKREEMIAVIEKARAANVKVMLSLAGGGLEEAEEQNWRRYTKSYYRTRFIQNLLKFVRYYKIDGVDVDLEWDLVNEHYSGFVLELRDSLDKYDRLMSGALPGWVRYKHLNSRALRAFDFVNVMAYDLTGPWKPDQPGQHSPYLKAKSSIRFWKKQGLSARKIVLGVPFFGWDFSDRSDVHSVTFGKLVAEDSTFAYLDQVGQIYYNGIPLIESKVEMAIKEAGGVMIWELGQDDFGRFSLLNQINKTLIKKEIREAMPDPLEPVAVPEIPELTLSYPSTNEFYVIIDNRKEEPLQQQVPVIGETVVKEAVQPEPKIELSRIGSRITLAFKLEGQKRAFISMPNYPTGFYLTLRMIKDNFFKDPEIEKL